MAEPSSRSRAERQSESRGRRSNVPARQAGTTHGRAEFFGPADRLRHLQRTLGNEAVEALWKNGELERSSLLGPTAVRRAPSGPEHAEDRPASEGRPLSHRAFGAELFPRLTRLVARHFAFGPLDLVLMALGLKRNGIAVGIGGDGGSQFVVGLQTGTTWFGVYNIARDEFFHSTFFTAEATGGGSAEIAANLGVVVSFIYTKRDRNEDLQSALGGTAAATQVSAALGAGAHIQISLGTGLFTGADGAITYRFGVTVGGGGGLTGSALVADLIASSITQPPLPGPQGPSMFDTMDRTNAQILRAAFKIENYRRGSYFPIGGTVDYDRLLGFIAGMWLACAPASLPAFQKRVHLPLSGLPIPAADATNLYQQLRAYDARILTHADVYDAPGFLALSPARVLRILWKNQIVEYQGNLCDEARKDARQLEESFSEFAAAGACGILTLEDLEPRK